MILNKENMRNKKVILILCLLVLVSSSVQAQRLKAVQNEKGRYGFMTEDGTVVIKYKYDEATPFKDGIAKIGKDGKYSLINEDGEIITKRKYTYIGEFYNGVCPVAEGGNTKKGVMLTTGGLIGNKASSNTGEKWGLIDKTGKEILKTDYEAMGDLNKKLIYVLKGKKFGFIDSAGNIIVKPTYNFIGSFNNQGICWVNIGGKYDKKNNMVSKGKFGLINENGREIIPAKYEDVGNFPVLRDKKTGALLDEAAFYTKADQSAFPATKQEIQSLLLPKPHAAESQLSSSRVDYFYFINKKSQGLVDIHGNTIIPLTANQAILPPSDNMLRLAKVEKKQIAKAYYDLDAEVMVRISSSEKGKFGAFSHNLAPVSLDDELFFIDKKGNKVIGGLSKAFLSNEGYRVVQKGSAFGAIDSTGAVVIPIEYTNSLTSVNNGRLGVQKNASWFYVDMKGQIVSDKYDRIGNFHQGYAIRMPEQIMGGY